MMSKTGMARPVILWLAVVLSVSGTVLNREIPPLAAIDEAVLEYYCPAKYPYAFCNGASCCSSDETGFGGKIARNGCEGCKGKFADCNDEKRQKAKGCFNGTPVCEKDKDIGGAKEDLRDAGVKPTAKDCQAECQAEERCEFFVWGGPNHSKANGCWLKQLKKGQIFTSLRRGKLIGGLSGKKDCIPEDEAKAPATSGDQCKFVAVAKDKCPGGESFLPKCKGDMNNGEFCEAVGTLPDGTLEYEVRNCGVAYWNIFQCIRDEYKVTEGACRTKDDKYKDAFPCEAGTMKNLAECKRKCNSVEKCGAVSWNGNICCGVTKKTTTTKETAWQCFSKP